VFSDWPDYQGQETTLPHYGILHPGTYALLLAEVFFLASWQLGACSEVSNSITIIQGTTQNKYKLNRIDLLQ